MSRVTEILREHCNLPLDEGFEEKASVIAERLVSENKKYNLTALVDDSEVALLHLYDSLSVFTAVETAGKRVIDVGCGGGFPSLVLAACEPKARVTALDSTAKKIAFVAETAKLAGIGNLEAVAARAEEFVALEGKRESYDLAVSRGVARLNVLAELCLPFVKVGGVFVAMKGSRGAEEAEEAERGLKVLGARVKELLPVRIPVFEREHCLVVMEKTAPTPAEYPRQYARILKKPL